MWSLNSHNTSHVHHHYTYSSSIWRTCYITSRLLITPHILLTVPAGVLASVVSHVISYPSSLLVAVSHYIKAHYNYAEQASLRCGANVTRMTTHSLSQS